MFDNPEDIFTQHDLKNLLNLKSKTIIKSIIIRGEHVEFLYGIEKIKGTLGICDSNIKSLGDLKEIEGDFWISSHTVYSPLKSLGNLEKVGGNLSLPYSNVVDLGKLRIVEGKINLRDTQINNLGSLEYVGENLSLPKRVEGLIDLTNVMVKGTIRYWNDKKGRKIVPPKSELGLTKSERVVPYWEFQYTRPHDDMRSTSPEQQSFYKYYKDLFLRGKYIDLEGNNNYAFILLYDLLSDYDRHKDINKLENQYKFLGKYYPKTNKYTNFLLAELFEEEKDYERAWQQINHQEFIEISTVYEYERKLKRSLLDVNLVIKLAGYSHLTDYGQRNIENIKPFVSKSLREYEKDKGCKFFRLFFDGRRYYKSPISSDREHKSNIFSGLFSRGKSSTTEKSSYDPYYYKQFYPSEAEFHQNLMLEGNLLDRVQLDEIPYIVEKAIQNQLKIIIKNAEDLYRESIGMPKIGEGWISETELYYKIVNQYPQYEVIQHGSPNWLGSQHLDIYIPEINVGIEYQGLQHFEAIEYFGGEDGLEKIMELDVKKRRKCEKNDCVIIYVEKGYDFEDVKQQIQDRINKLNAQI